MSIEGCTRWTSSSAAKPSSPRPSAVNAASQAGATRVSQAALPCCTCRHASIAAAGSPSRIASSPRSSQERGWVGSARSASSSRRRMSATGCGSPDSSSCTACSQWKCAISRAWLSPDSCCRRCASSIACGQSRTACATSRRYCSDCRPKRLCSRRWKQSSARSSRPAFQKSWPSSNSACSRCAGSRSARSTRCWCTRMARSVSPRRRNRFPSAKCSSIVSGSIRMTSMNASIA